MMLEPIDMSTPEKTLEALKARAKSSRMIESLEAIHSVCSDMQKSGYYDYTVAAIARLGAGRGVPKAQSMRNKTGEPYRVLITAWNESKTRNAVAKKSPNEPERYAWIQEINEPKLRYLAQDLAARMSELQGDVQRLKQLTHLKIDMRRGQCSKQESRVNIDLTDWEIDALKAAIDAEFIKAQGWTTDNKGRIKVNGRRTLFAHGFVTAIQKIIASKER